MLEITTTAEIQTQGGKAWVATQMMVATNFVQFLRALKMFGTKMCIKQTQYYDDLHISVQWDVLVIGH